MKKRKLIDLDATVIVDLQKKADNSGRTLKAHMEYVLTSNSNLVQGDIENLPKSSYITISGHDLEHLKSLPYIPKEQMGSFMQSTVPSFWKMVFSSARDVIENVTFFEEKEITKNNKKYKHWKLESEKELT